MDEVLIMLKMGAVIIGDCSGRRFSAAFTRCFVDVQWLISDKLFLREMFASLSIAAGFLCPFWSLM